MAFLRRDTCVRAAATTAHTFLRGVATAAAPNCDLHRWADGLRHGLPKFTGLATFFRQPFRDTLAGLDVALVGVPYDSGANHPGTRLGPREIRNKSSVIRRVNQATGVRPFDLCAVADVGDAWVSRPYAVSTVEPTDGLRACHDEIQAFYNQLCAAGVSPVTAGGVRQGTVVLSQVSLLVTLFHVWRRRTIPFHCPFCAPCARQWDSRWR